MANDRNHGGQRTPANPAAVSGPGSLSQRTDGNATSQPPMVASGGEYGSRKEMEAIQQAAGMAGGGNPVTPAPNVVPLNAPSQRPEEPVTAGAAAGAGVNPQAAGIMDDDQGTFEQMKPMLNSLVQMANLPSSTPQFRSFVRKLRVRANQQQSL